MARANLMEWLNRRHLDLEKTIEQADKEIAVADQTTRALMSVSYTVPAAPRTDEQMRADESHFQQFIGKHYALPSGYVGSVFPGGPEEWHGVISSDNSLKEPASVPVPDRVALAEPDGPDAEYLALAAKLGIVSAAILEARLEQVLHAEMIYVYDYSAVAAYLDSLVGKRNYELAQSTPIGIMARTARWGWCSLRNGEHKDVYAPKLTGDVYQAAIPKPVLLTIARIQTQLPEARFFISRIAEVADPFLAVTVPGSTKLHVSERWDEPGFRG